MRVRRNDEGAGGRLLITVKYQRALSHCLSVARQAILAGTDPDVAIREIERVTGEALGLSCDDLGGS